MRFLHTLETPFVFNNVAGAKALTGAGPEALRLAEEMSEAWVSFLLPAVIRTLRRAGYRIGPTYQYQPGTRATMLFRHYEPGGK